LKLECVTLEAACRQSEFKQLSAIVFWRKRSQEQGVFHSATHDGIAENPAFKSMSLKQRRNKGSKAEDLLFGDRITESLALHPRR